MATFYSNTSVVYRLRLDLNEQSQSQANNQTVLAYSLKFEKTNAAYSAYQYAGRDEFKLSINDATIYDATPAWDLQATTSQMITSGTVTITHDADGNKTVPFSFSFKPQSKVNNYYPGEVSGSGTLALTKIIRASVPTLSPASIICNGQNAFTITTNRALATYTHRMVYTIGEASGIIGENIGDSTTWTPPAALLQQIPNAASGSGMITTTTYSGAAVIGTTTVSFTIRTETAAALSNVAVTETGTNKVTGANTVRYLSQKTIMVTTAAFQGADAQQVTVTCGGVTKALTRSGNAWTYTGLTGMTAASYTITMTDTRGLTRTQTVAGTFYAYTYPTIQSLTVGRDTATSSTGSLEAEGECYDGLNNAVSAQISGGQTQMATVAASGGAWEIDEAMTGLAYDQSFEFTLTITDSFGQSASKDISLAVSKWTLWMGQNTVKIQDDLMVAGEIKIGGVSLLDLLHPVGSVYLTIDPNDNPADRFGGTWSNQDGQGRYLMGAGGSYSGGSTGGYITKTTQSEGTGYGLTQVTQFANRVLIQGNPSLVNSADYRQPYLAVYIWIRTA